MKEAAIIVKMKNEAILIPSGRSNTLVIVVYMNTSEIAANAVHQTFFLFLAEIVTAIAAEDIKTKTPVA